MLRRGQGWEGVRERKRLVARNIMTHRVALLALNKGTAVTLCSRPSEKKENKRNRRM